MQKLLLENFPNSKLILKYEKDLLLFSSLQNYKITINLKGKSINHL